jgi:hypothetical protein
MIEKDLKEKIKKIYEVLPKTNDRRCGYRTCGEFARAVSMGEAPCDGCITGGYETAKKVCSIMGEKIEDKEKYSPGYTGSEMAFAGLYGRSGGRGGRYKSRYNYHNNMPSGKNLYNYTGNDMGPDQEKIFLGKNAELIEKRLHEIKKRLKELEKE